MGFVYEKVGEENRELWESIGWKDWGESPIPFCPITKWSIDKEQQIYMQPIGGYIDMPDYHDLAYKGIIIRMEVIPRGNGTRATGFNKVWIINRIYIPKSIFEEKEQILEVIKESFSVYRGGTAESRVKSISVKISCEPECVEMDYNGR